MLKVLVKSKMRLAVGLSLMLTLAAVNVGFRFSDAALGKAPASESETLVIPKTDLKIEKPADMQPKAETKAEAKAAEPVKAVEPKVIIDKYGVIKEFAAKCDTVDKTLNNLGISYAGKVVYPALNTPVKPGMLIHVLGKYESLTTETVDVPYATQFVEDKKMPYGKTEVVTAGIPGRDEITYKNVLRTGVFQKIEVGRKHVSLPQSAVVKKGTAHGIKTSQGYVSYKNKMVVETSAYTLGEGSGTGLTSIGIEPYEGIVAVDPRVIPYYTKLYIPGYGFAMAGDTGGAIVGHRVDLFMESYYSAIQWGRRTVEIYIL